MMFLFSSKGAFLLLSLSGTIFEAGAKHLNLRSALQHGHGSNSNPLVPRRRLNGDSVLPPSATVMIDPECVDEAGKGGSEIFAVTLAISGAGGTTASTIPMDVVFAIDSSGSMGWNDPEGLRKTAAKNFVDLLSGTRDKVGVVSWDGGIDFSYGLSSNFIDAKTKIDQVNSDGGTNLNVGLSAAIALLDTDTDPIPVKVIIFLTDGQGTYTYFSNNGPAATAQARGYKIYSIGLSGSAQTGPLMDMADNTGGTYYASPSPENLNDIFNAIFTEVLQSTVPYNIAVTATVDPCHTIGNTSPPASVTGNTIVWPAIDGGTGLAGDADPKSLTFEASSNCHGANLAVVHASSSVVYTSSTNAVPYTTPIPGITVNVNAKPVANCIATTKSVDEYCQACFSLDEINNGSADTYTCPNNNVPTLTISWDPSACFGVGDHPVTLTATDERGLSDTCDTTVTVTNNPPTAVCTDVTRFVNNGDCQHQPPYLDDLIAEIGDGSSDPENHPLDYSLSNGGPYGLGQNFVTLTVTDKCGLTHTCDAVITVLDPEALIERLNLDCGNNGVITPPDVPLSYTPSYFKYNGCLVDVSVTEFGCRFCNGGGKTVDKYAGGSCIVNQMPDEFTISDSGGVGDHIEFGVKVCNEGTQVCGDFTCTICVDNPGKGGECAEGWDARTDIYECDDIDLE